MFLPLQTLARDVRHKTLQLLDACRPAELTWAPAGTSNHVLWHAGHALWVQDALCVQVVTGRSELPPGYAELFAMGSRPAQPRRPWPARDALRRHLAEQLPRLLELLDGLRDADLEVRPPFAHRGDGRTLGQCVVHGLHDEANHQGEMYLLLKVQRLGPGRG
jgi:DinB superfamily